MGIKSIIEFDRKEKKEYYKLMDVNTIKNGNGNGREKNGGNYYLIKLGELDPKTKNIEREFEIKIKTMYQIFILDGIVWGFDNFNHRHCYLDECPLKVELLTPAPFKEREFNDSLEEYFKKLEAKENIKNLEEWEQEEIRNNKIFKKYL